MPSRNQLCTQHLAPFPSEQSEHPFRDEGQAVARWRTASNKATPAATETLRLSS